jgi:hypothetical protein
LNFELCCAAHPVSGLDPDSGGRSREAADVFRIDFYGYECPDGQNMYEMFRPFVHAFSRQGNHINRKIQPTPRTKTPYGVSYHESPAEISLVFSALILWI